MITILEPKKVDKVVLFIHGMQDYRLRYLDFWETLKEQNTMVILPDLNGHGENKPHGTIGGIDKQRDELLDLAKKYKQSKVPLILIGHSMGSLYSRYLLMKEPTLFDAVILSGTPNYHPSAKVIAPLLDGYAKLFRRRYKQNIVLNWGIIKQFNMKVKNPRTTHDWLSFDQANVDSFLNNPYCKFKFSNDGFVDLFKLLIEVNKKGKKSSSTPVYFLTGKHDPCNNGNIDKAIQVLKSYGHPVKCEWYLNSRHEILFDLDKEMVKQDIIEILDSIKNDFS